MTHNNIAFLELLEKQRANQTQERETHRANLAKEELTRYSTDVSASTSQLVAGINRESQAYVAQTNAGASMANARLNAETQRYNIDVTAGLRQQELDETSRHNIVTEDIGQTQNVINSMRVTEDINLAYARLEQDDYYRGVTAEQHQQEIDNALVIGSGGIVARLAPALAGLVN